MATFDSSSVSHEDLAAFQNRGLALQIATVRQIDRIFNKSGNIHNPTTTVSLSYSITMAKNLKWQCEFLARMLTPYVGKEMPESIQKYSDKLKNSKPRTEPELEAYLDTVLNLFGAITIQLGYVDLLPAMHKGYESGTD